MNPGGAEMNRVVLSLSVALLTAAAAPAQDWAKSRLEKSPRHGEWVKVEQGKREIQSFVVYPEL
jgi:carboxymethylenebutenolidase